MGSQQPFEVSMIQSMGLKDGLYPPISVRSQQAPRHTDTLPIWLMEIESEEGCIKLALNIEPRVN